MKQRILFLLCLFYVNFISAQKGVTYTQAEIYTKAKKATDDYLLNYFSKEEYNAYLKINDEYSKISYNVPFNQMASNNIDPNWISEIEVSVECTSKEYHTFITLNLRKDFTVKENIAYYRNNENTTALFIQSIKDYLTIEKNHKILNADSVRQFVSTTYPDKKWGKAKISRNSFPPYQFYYEVMEDSCSTCKKVFIQLTEFALLGDHKVEMVPIEK